MKKYVNDKFIGSILIILFFLNIADAISTHYWVSRGVAEELNPYAVLLLNSPLLFFFVKCLLGSVCFLFLWKIRTRHRNIVFAVSVCWLLVYTLVLISHVVFFIHYFNEYHQ